MKYYIYKEGTNSSLHTLDTSYVIKEGQNINVAGFHRDNRYTVLSVEPVFYRGVQDVASMKVFVRPKINGEEL